MPQITLEHSPHFDGTDWRALALTIHEECVTHTGATMDSCKTRIVRADTIVINDGNPDEAFVHCDLRILSGRTQEQKTALGQAAHAAILKSLPAYAGPAQITLEVVDLDRPNYHKVSLKG